MIAKSYEVQRKPSSFLKYNLFLMYGENDGLKKDIKELIKSHIQKQDKNIELLNIYENDITENSENFYNSIFTGSLFGNKKIITINNGTDKIYNLMENIVEKFPENIYLFIFSEILDKKSKLRKLFETNEKILSIPCYADSQKDLEFIANNELRKNNINLSREMTNLLIEKSNNDRSNLKNEIEKLIILLQNKKKLNIEELNLLINFTGEIKSDNFVNECLCGNISQYKKILAEAYMDTVNQIYMLRILSNKIQRLLKMKELESDSNNVENLINTSKPPIFWKEKPMVKKQLEIWKLKDLKTSINEINDTELLCKKNPHLSKIVFFNLFTKICERANNYS